MKRKSVEKLLILSSLAVVTLFSCNKDKGGSSSTGYPVYAFNSSGTAYKAGNFPLKFFTIPNLPYVNVSEYLYSFALDTYSVSRNNDVFTFTNKLWNGKQYYNGNSYGTYNATATYNQTTKNFTYADYASFANIDSRAYNPLDLTSAKADSISSYFYVAPTDNIYIPGGSKTINLGNYNIETKVVDGNLYMPLYTAHTLFANNTYSYFFNGSALYQNIENTNSSYDRQIKNGLFTPTSDYLNYAFDQMRLDLALRFGLNGYERTLRKGGKHTYNPATEIESLRSSFVSSTTNFDNQSVAFYKTNMDDGGHTIINSKSYYATNPTIADDEYGNEVKYLSASYNNVRNNRVTGGQYPKKGSLLLEDLISKTVLRLDSFTTSDEGDPGIEKIISLMNLKSTMQERLIIDLSCNGGGYIFAQVLLTSYLTKGNSLHCVQSSVNGSRSSIKFKIDLDKNGIPNEQNVDLLPEKVTEIDLITSNATFSAANATAALVNKYGNSNATTVKVYGEQSGGGTCAVDSGMMNALGMNSTWSSTYRISLDKEIGSYEGIDNPVYSFTKDFDSHSDDEDELKRFSQYNNLDN